MTATGGRNFDRTEERLWGPETAKAIANFPVSGEVMPLPIVHWLATIKAAAARVNGELGLLDADRSRRITEAAESVAAGSHDGQFPVDVFQTGSGTSTNMNVNEVIATLAGPDTNPNDHVNLGQSSNDVFPTAVHLAALDGVENDLLPALRGLQSALEAKAGEFTDVLKAARTHLMDAVPITLGQEFSGYAVQIRLGAERVTATLPRVAQVPLGGTAVGTGLNTHPEFADRVRRAVAEATGVGVGPPAHPFESQASRDSLVELSGATKTVAVSLTKVASDLALMGSGPNCGLDELRLPSLQRGSSIMPGKVNPVIPEVVCQVAAQVIGNDTAISVAAGQGHFELNARVPVIARNLLQSISLLAAASRLLADRCVTGVEANVGRLASFAGATPAVATALNPLVGYERAAQIVGEAQSSGRSLRAVAIDAGLDPAVVDRALDLRRIAGGGLPDLED